MILLAVSILCQIQMVFFSCNSLHILVHVYNSVATILVYVNYFGPSFSAMRHWCS